MFIETKIYNKLIGILYFEQETKRVLFEYDKKFLTSNLEIVPNTYASFTKK